MIAVRDDLNQQIFFESRPKRIISLTPSSTETICALGARDRLVGLTRYCVHPTDISKEKTIVGGTKSIDLELMASLQPDLVIANAEENTTEIFEQIKGLNCQLYIAFPKNIDDALVDLNRMGQLLEAEKKARQYADEIAEKRHASNKPFRYIYLIWKKPYMAVNKDTFIHHMISEIGGINVLADHKDRYPSLGIDFLRESTADVILLSSEPFPFKERHRQEIIKEIGFPSERVQFIDGEMCSWHGIRMASAFQYLHSWKDSLLQSVT